MYVLEVLNTAVNIFMVFSAKSYTFLVIISMRTSVHFLMLGTPALIYVLYFFKCCSSIRIYLYNRAVEHNKRKCPLPFLIYKSTVISIKIIYANKLHSFRIGFKWHSQQFKKGKEISGFCNFQTSKYSSVLFTVIIQTQAPHQ
jgi:hypothetical protein